MLREMLRQPGAKNPDARFFALLHTLATKYAYRALSTSDLQHEVEAVMTPAMDLEGGHSMEWFFEQWVRGTGVPRYRVEYSVHNSDKGYVGAREALPGKCAPFFSGSRSAVHGRKLRTRLIPWSCGCRRTGDFLSLHHPDRTPQSPDRPANDSALRHAMTATFSAPGPQAAFGRFVFV